MNKNFFLPSYILTFVSVFFLTACGGNSSTGGSTTTTNGSYTFTLTSSLSNQCGIDSAFTDIELLLQDEDWQITARYSPDENGDISFTSSDEYINYTLVAATQTGDSVAGLDISSFYQAQASTSSVYKATYDSLIDNTSCECITNNVTLTHRFLATRRDAYSSLPYSSTATLNENTTVFNDVEACREIDQDWPTASFMVTGESANQDMIGAANFLSDFPSDLTQDENWSLAALEIPEEISLNANEELDFTASQIFADDEHFFMNISEADESMLVFNNHLYISEAFYKLHSEQIIDTSSTLFSESTLSSQRQLISTSYDDTYNSEIDTDDIDVDIDYISFSELSADGSFDYSAVNDHPMSIVTFTYQVLNDSGSYYPVTWRNYHANSGLLASSVALTDYPDVVNQATTIIENTNVTLLRSFNTNKYQDYINYFQSHNNLSDNATSDDDFNQDIHFYYISHQPN